MSETDGVQDAASGIAAQVRHFPTQPGVYIMRGEAGEVLYVGKAKNLRNRVRAYLTPDRDSRFQIQFLMNRVTTVDCIVTDTEKEALILENTLIKEHRPRYNINLRDDKTYFSLRMDLTEEFPALAIVRQVKRDEAHYFGPYSSAAAAREVLKELYHIFPLRHYPLETCRRRRRPCLYYQMHLCSAPCHGKISVDDYRQLAQGAALFLEGRDSELLRYYKQRMATAAEGERYEEAARYRDLIRSIEVTLERQKVVTGVGDSDVVGFARQGSRLQLTLMFYRGGKLIGSRGYPCSWELDDAEGLSSFLTEYYGGEVFIPQAVLLPLAFPEVEAVAEFLSERRGKQVTVTVPQRGIRADLVRLAQKNAESALAQEIARQESMEEALADLASRLNLPRTPRLMECYDISNLQGNEAVGSRVTFVDGRPAKEKYRRYRIRSVAGANDFAMMAEVLGRRFRDVPPAEYPDLIIVDGGVGQLNALMAVLQELGIEGVPGVGLAKSRVERDMAATEVRRSDERVFLPGRKNPLILRQNSPALLLLARIRDEAHRFAITYHRGVRQKRGMASELLLLPGIGSKRQRELLRHFGSLDRLRQATVEELSMVVGMNGQVAKRLWKHLREGSGVEGQG
jgi:excinuclease ABC subunit C